MSIRYSFPPDSHEEQRARMVRDQIEQRGLRNERVLEAMRAVPRHAFLPAENRASAYADSPLPIGCRQTISQPYIVAYMTEGLDLRGDERVLEIGTGSGYQTAILACLASAVFSIERVSALATGARERLTALGIDNVEIVTGDGTLGLPEHAPYDAILVTAAAPAIPRSLFDQLEPDGRLLAPVGGRGVQDLELWRRIEGEFQRKTLIPVVFVPLIGEYGWSGE